jgi:hypothetical protein
MAASRENTTPKLKAFLPAAASRKEQLQPQSRLVNMTQLHIHLLHVDAHHAAGLKPSGGGS